MILYDAFILTVSPVHRELVLFDQRLIAHCPRELITHPLSSADWTVSSPLTSYTLIKRSLLQVANRLP